MIWLVISIAYAAVMVVVLALCKAAALGDRMAVTQHDLLLWDKELEDA